MDWTAFLAAIAGGSITAIASYYISKKTIKADSEKTQKEIIAKFNIEVTAQSKQEWIDNLRTNVAHFASIQMKINLFSIHFEESLNDNMKRFTDNVTMLNFHKSYIELMLTGSDEEFPLLIDKMNYISNKVNRLAFIHMDIYDSANNTKLHAELTEQKHSILVELYLCTDRVIELTKRILKNTYTSKEDLKKKEL